MAVFPNRPYERHMVSNIPTLLAAGNTLDALAVGQLGIFDAKTNLSVTAPTYAVNKTIYIAQGTPDRSYFPEGAGVPNMVRKTHPIQGKRLLSLRGKKANRGLSEIVTLGNTGVAGDTKTLTAKPGSTFYYWVRLTGDPIFNLNPDTSKGFIVQGAVQMPCKEECADNCEAVDCNTIADLVVADWNTKLMPGGQKVTKYAEMCKVASCADDPAFTTVDYDACSLSIVDDGSQSALGLVQAQAGPTFLVTRTGRNGLVSTYETAPKVSPSACPAAFNQAAGTIIPDCDACPAGATATPALTQFDVKVQQTDATDQSAAIDATLEAAHVGYDFTVTLAQYDANVGTATYRITSTIVLGVAITAAQITADLAATVDGIATLVGTSSPFCTLAASTTAWTDLGVVCHRVQVQFTIDLADDVCGNTIEAELQELYGTIAVDGGTVTGTVTVNEGAGCTHRYTLTTYSKNCVPDDCCADDVEFPIIPDYGTQAWTPVALPTATAPCYCGLRLTSPYVPRVTKECTFDQFAYQTDWVHMEISSHNPDWRSTDLCETDPIATRIQNGAYPNGAGQAVARLEKADRMYDMDYFYMSPVLREAFDFYFETNMETFYDMVAVEYDFQYSSNDGFGQTDTDRYIQYFWLPETQAGALVTALNTYAASVPILVDPIVL